jgi:hypothetical protein
VTQIKTVKNKKAVSFDIITIKGGGSESNKKTSVVRRLKPSFFAL